MTSLVGVNGTFEHKSAHPYREGDIATIKCDPGYVSNIQISRLVMKDSILQWDPPLIECKPRSCGRPPFIDNGKIIGNEFTFPNSFHYICNPGYKLNSFKKYYCSPTGEWTPEIKNVSCIPVECDELKKPENGTVTYLSRVFESIATYKCNAGYKLVGKKTRICTANGTWSEQEPKCEDIVFKLPAQPPPNVSNSPSPIDSNLHPVLNSKPPSPTDTNLPPVLNPQPPFPIDPNLNPVLKSQPPSSIAPNLPPVLNPQPPSPIAPNLPQPPVLKPRPQSLFQSKKIIIVICILLMVLSILLNIKNR